MFKTLKVSAIAIMLLAVTPVVAAPDFTDLVEASVPAVVNIETTRFGTRPDETSDSRRQEMPEDMPEFFRRFFEEPFGGGPRGRPDRQGGGSGFIIDAEGLVITNHHVIDGADEIIVRLADRREFEAELVGSDAETDIAVLRIPADDLPTLEFGGTESLKPGEWVIAIGSPFQFEQSVTAGIVSAKGRSQGSQQQYVPFIQTDVAINRGNSGGPLINTDGKVVGINSWILSSHGGNIGLSFSIPSEVARNSVEQLLEHGRVSRGFLGVTLQAVSREQADALELERPAGALINQVEPGSPADEAGIEVGDVILEFEGMPIDRHSELPPLVGMERPGTEVELTVWRWGERRTLEVTLGEQDASAIERGRDGDSAAEPSNALGLVVEPLNSELRRRYGDPDGGVLISEVESDNAYRAGIRQGQLILMINNQPVGDMDDFEQIVSAIEPGQTVALLVQQANGASAFLAYRPESGEDE
ncbi:Do family serine endopeptidase [Wenzhouxiangella sp. XN201]|uniref:Do family serine endopeptidase n=1 Tax=Wenzhouxiangella sp. XN201 TaxID=2710755 RepID=UPI0013CB061C|nr:Do family serine endopeptidase [Wenzhouxiangella sp. XN201]NEZ05126.1 Do family serine endopeptidase [Wenzhouxiangella sp. XN201]